MRTIVAPLRLLRRISFREPMAPVIRGLISLAKVASHQIMPLLQKVVGIGRKAMRPEHRGVVGDRLQFKAVGDEIVHTLVADGLPFVWLTFR